MNADQHRTDLLLDSHTRLTAQLAAAHANLWRAHDLLLEIADMWNRDLHGVDRDRQQTRLHLELQQLLLTLPPIITVPRDPGRWRDNRGGEAPTVTPPPCPPDPAGDTLTDDAQETWPCCAHCGTGSCPPHLTRCLDNCPMEPTPEWQDGEDA